MPDPATGMTLASAWVAFLPLKALEAVPTVACPALTESPQVPASRAHSLSAACLCFLSPSPTKRQIIPLPGWKTVGHGGTGLQALAYTAEGPLAVDISVFALWPVLGGTPCLWLTHLHTHPDTLFSYLYVFC